MRRRRIRHQDDELGAVAAQKKREATAESAPAPLQRHEEGRPLTAESAADLQRRYGNAYVQRLVQRQEDEAAEGANEATPMTAAAKPKEYEFHSTAKMDEQGKLTLDLKPLLELRHMEVTDKELQSFLKTWVGLGVAQLGEEVESDTAEMEINTDGLLEMELGEPFLAAMNQKGKAHELPLDKNAPFGPQGLAATASLHFDRKEIDRIKLDGKEDLLKSPKNKRGMMLMVQLESPFPHQLDEDEQELFQGLMLFVGTD